MRQVRIISICLSLIAGIAIGWSIHGRTKTQHPSPLSFNFPAGHDIRIVQPALSGDEWRLKPFAVHYNDRKILFDDPPADSSHIWLVTYDGVIVSCRSEQAPSQHP